MSESNLLTVGDLYALGWTDAIIEKLPEPTWGVNPHHPNRMKKVPLWHREDVVYLAEQPKIRAMLERTAARHAKRIERRSAKQEARHQRALDACETLSKLFDVSMLGEMTEGDRTAELLVQRLHEGILKTLMQDCIPIVHTITDAQNGLREVMEMTDGRYSKFLKNPTKIVACAPYLGKGETKRGACVIFSYGRTLHGSASAYRGSTAL